jgi:hypothetical protein
VNTILEVYQLLHFSVPRSWERGGEGKKKERKRSSLFVLEFKIDEGIESERR